MSSQTSLELCHDSTPYDFVFSAMVVSVMVAFLLICPGSTIGQIVKPNDAPKPLSPAETSQRFTVPPRFRVELVASEPQVLEPSGVCWDERGDLYVCELHGYNLEGQYDIEELNKTGQLDRVVRRIQADERHKKAAETGTYGTIKRLKDRDGDGRMDIAASNPMEQRSNRSLEIRILRNREMQTVANKYFERNVQAAIKHMGLVRLLVLI